MECNEKIVHHFFKITHRFQRNHMLVKVGFAHVPKTWGNKSVLCSGGILEQTLRSRHIVKRAQV
jgi:hypothetical protein